MGSGVVFCVDPSPEKLKYILPLDHELRTKLEVSKDAQWSRSVPWIRSTPRDKTGSLLA